MGYLCHTNKPDSTWGCCRECVGGSFSHGPTCERRLDPTSTLPPPPPPADKSKERAPKRPQANPKAPPLSPPPGQKRQRHLSPLCLSIDVHKEGEPKRRKLASPPPTSGRKLVNFDNGMNLKIIDGIPMAVTAKGQILPGTLKWQPSETALPDCTDGVAPGEAAANSDHDHRVSGAFSKSASRCTSAVYSEPRDRDRTARAAQEPRLRSRRKREARHRSRSSSGRRKTAPRKKEEKRREVAETMTDATEEEVADYSRNRSPSDRKRPPKRSVKSASRRRRGDRSRGRRSPQ